MIFFPLFRLCILGLKKIIDLFIYFFIAFGFATMKCVINGGLIILNMVSKKCRSTDTFDNLRAETVILSLTVLGATQVQLALFPLGWAKQTYETQSPEFI